MKSLPTRTARPALVRLGVKPGDRVILVSENRYEWIVLDLAIQMARAIDVAVHSTLTGPQIAYQIVNSGAKIVFVSGPEQAQKLAAVAGHLPPRFNTCRSIVWRKKLEITPSPCWPRSRPR